MSTLKYSNSKSNIWKCLVGTYIGIFTSKKGGQRGVALLYSRLYMCVTVCDYVKFEFNDMKSLYKKNDSERRCFSQ